MSQIMFIGSSSVYGVGGENGGLPDLIKQNIHTEMYKNDGLGEVHEIYNLAVPGASSKQSLERVLSEVETRSKSRQIVALLSGGSNDVKLLSSPSDTSMDDKFQVNITQILKILENLKADIIIYGITPVDETKTTPKFNHKRNIAEYFFNESRKRLENILVEVGKSKNLTAIPLFDSAIGVGWKDNYLYQDGLHPNTKGHQWITEKLKPEIFNRIGL